MGSMNRQKMIVGGIVAGVILIVLDYVSGTFVFTPMAAGTPGSMSAALTAVMSSKRAMVGGFITDLLYGITIVWCYAAIRPRYGAGSKTGMCAAAFVWFVSVLAYATFYLDRMMSLQFFCIVALAELISMLIAGYVGCMMYSEGGAS